MTSGPDEHRYDMAPMTKTNAAAVADLFADATADGGGGGWDGDAIRTALERGGHGRVASSAAGALLGAALALPAGDDHEVANIAVVRDVRGRGLGSAVLQALLEDMRRRGAERSVLEVRADNAAAIAMYIRHGFRRVGERPGYYRRSNTKIDAYVFAYDFNA